MTPAFDPNDLLSVAPALILAGGAIVLLLSEVFLSTPSRGHQPIIAVIAAVGAGVVAFGTAFEPRRGVFLGLGVQDPFSSFLTVVVCIAVGLAVLLAAGFRSEERRVGKECRSRWSPYH